MLKAIEDGAADIGHVPFLSRRNRCPKPAERRIARSGRGIEASPRALPPTIIRESA